MNLLASCLIISLLLVFTAARDHQNFTKILENIYQNETKIRTACTDDLIRYQNTRLFQTWSNFSSTHKYGNSHDFGDFFGCNSISNVQYCMVQYFYQSSPPISVLPSISYYQRIWIDLDVSFLGAVCLPSSCDSKDVREILGILYDGEIFTFGEKNFCKPRKNEKFGIQLNKYNYAYLNWLNVKRIGILLLILLLAVIFSMSDVKSLCTSNIIKDLFDFSHVHASTAYLNGAKALTIALITFYHSYLYKVVMPFKSGRNLQKFTTEGIYQLLGFTCVIMDVFFVIGGAFTAMSLKKGLGNSNKLSWIVKFYIKRCMRILPVAILVVILLMTSDSDSLAPYNVGIKKDAKVKLWFLPFVYNFMDYSNMHGNFIWYISVYLQLSIMAPFVLLLTRMEKYGNYFSILLMSAFGIVRYLHTSDYYYGRIFTVENSFFVTDDGILHKYVAARFRFFPFFGGLIVENFLGEKSSRDMVGLKIASAVAFAIGACMIISGAILSIPELISVADVLLVMDGVLFFYIAHHSNWKIKKFSSLKIWEPISRMGLSIYLISSYYLSTIYERRVDPLEIENEFHFLTMLTMDVLKCLIPVLLTFVFVEEPFSRFGDHLAKIF